MKRIVLLSILLFIGKYLFSQDCDHFHRGVECRLTDLGGFDLYNQSRSAKVQYGDINKYQVALFGNSEYKISVCIQAGFGLIHFRIMNLEDQRVIYDNKKYNYVESMTLSNDMTKVVVFEISFIDTQENAKVIWDTGICLGVLIYWHKLKPNEL